MNYGEILNLTEEITARPDLRETLMKQRFNWAMRRAHSLVDLSIDFQSVSLSTGTASSTIGTMQLPAGVRKCMYLIPTTHSGHGVLSPDLILRPADVNNLANLRYAKQDLNTFYVNNGGISYKSELALEFAELYCFKFPDLSFTQLGTSYNEEGEVGLMVHYGECIADLLASTIFQVTGNQEQARAYHKLWADQAQDIMNNAKGAEQHA